MVNLTIKDSRKSEFVMHHSTRSVAHILDEVKRDGFQPERLLDLGCGSGIIALYMAELWPDSHIIASDISPLAVSETKENIQANGALERIESVQADGFNHRLITEHAPYDLIVANLVAELQVKYIADIASHLDASGIAILSGILEWRMQEVEAALPHAGLALVNQFRADKWMTLVLAHASEAT